FFFQAEDGIRGRNVTGVQTCALPISGPVVVSGSVDQQHLQAPLLQPPHQGTAGIDALTLRHGLSDPSQSGGGWTSSAPADQGGEIGRASCRERAEAGGGAGRGEGNRW